MPRLMLFITQKVSPALKGLLTRWMLQLKPGVFIGTLSTLVGEKLWKKIIERQGEGGAIWVKAMNTEQRFQLKISGDNHWTLQEFDGLQLITRPYERTKIEENIKTDNSTLNTKKHPGKPVKKAPIMSDINWDKENLRDNLIVRKVSSQLDNGKIKTTFSGSSAYDEYSPQTLWKSPYKEEIQFITESILKYLDDNINTLPFSLIHKKISCIDIETTDFIPKAFEGFINIVGIAFLDFHELQHQKICLELTQIFNMTRKRAEVKYLLDFILPKIIGSNILLVFNKDFDIKILSHVIQEDSLNFSLPSQIEDLQVKFHSLKSLEQFLFSKTGIKRTITEKGKYSEYYSLFKGEGINGYNKQIEPIGTYNLTDVLTPLYAYFILSTENNNKNLI